MPIIKSNKDLKTEKIKLAINAELLQEITQYCTWAKVGDMSAFFEQAAEFVLNKDAEWKKHKKTNKS